LAKRKSIILVGETMKVVFQVLLMLFLGASLAQAKKLDLMVYNVENLFDAKHDKGKNDWTFTPDSKQKSEACRKVKRDYRKKECFETNWTQKHVDLKLSQISKVILNSDRKELPDILGLVEIENQNVVNQLAKKLGYKHSTTSDSPDKRGIDLALMWRSSNQLKFVTKREHKLDGEYFKKKPTRNILEVEFLVEDKYSLFVFVNHWPSLGNPDEARVIAATKLKKRIVEISKSVKNYNIVAMGDFNTIPKLKKKGNQHPFRDIFLKDSLMKDLTTTYNMSDSIKKELKASQPPGTYYYKRGKVWNMLDRVFISDNLLDGKGLDVELSSYEIYSPSFIRKGKTQGYKNELAPQRYNHRTMNASKAGFSDHFPIVFQIKY
jgi:endonuclease/exonuclease/phosphatase family metal-dependent hydrolase